MVRLYCFCEEEKEVGMRTMKPGVLPRENCIFYFLGDGKDVAWGDKVRKGFDMGHVANKKNVQ